MKCYQHPNANAISKCTKCGKDICSECRIDYYGKDICVECAKPLLTLFGCIMAKHDADQYIECSTDAVKKDADHYVKGH